MRVLFINTFGKGGGAAVVLWRMSNVLKRNYSIESFHLFGDRRGSIELSEETRNGLEGFIEKMIDRASRMVGAQYLYFPFSSRKIINAIKEFKPEVISLHNSHGGYFQTSLLRELSKYAPVVWTLHDMWSFTGNSAHTFNDVSWKEMKNSRFLTKVYPTIGLNAGTWLLQQKKRIYEDADLTLVAPSKWLSELALQSPVFRGKSIHHINNGLDLSLYRPQSKRMAREKFGIPENVRVIMFSAEQLNNNPWKGGTELLEILKYINDTVNFHVHLLAVGSGTLQLTQALPNLTFHYTGYVQDEETIINCYCAADVFLYPTKADNLPNVLVEAIACGTPCATFDVGGCKEIVINGYNGVILSPNYLSPLINMLSDSQALIEMSKNARSYAEAHFAIEEMGRRYFHLFKSLIQV